MSSETTEPPASEIELARSEVGRGAARYLFAVSRLSDGNDGRVRTGELREYLDVTPASVTKMVSKLDDRGLTDYEKYRGVRLTERGTAFATRIAWRFCVVSTFFDSVLETALDEQTAFEIAFILSKDGVFGLRDLVDSPCLSLCPESTGELDQCAC